jgi:hypothetical protein
MRRNKIHRQGPERLGLYEIPSWLQEAWIRRLRREFDFYNYTYCAEKLKPPLFRISAATETCGRWNSLARTIEISEQHILRSPWEEVVDTLRHEMAHQFVTEIFGLPAAPPHGEPFLKACRLLRCEPSATASAGSRLSQAQAEERDRMLLRVKELLALAGSPNEHEAANAMRMAHKYLLKYNLDVAHLEGSSTYQTRHLGRASARIQEYEYTLGALLQDHFFVLVIWTFSYDPLTDKPGRKLQILGTRENLEIAEYVYHYVFRVIHDLWEKRRRTVQKGRGTKLQYLAGLVRGLAGKLDRQKAELKEEHGLIWLGDPELKKYYKHLHPRTRSSAIGGVSRGLSFRDGVRDGQNITLRQALNRGGTNRGRQIAGPQS